MTSWGADVEAALQRAAVEPRDERGLMPLGEARAIVAAAEAFDGDPRMWAAVLSLGDGGELVAAAGRLAWRAALPGDGALGRRYGAGLMPWLEARVEERVLVDEPRGLAASLVAIDDLDALPLLWMLRGCRAAPEPGDVRNPDVEAAVADELRARWIDAHPDLALPWLVAAAERGDAVAIAALSARAEAAGPGFVAELAEDVGDARAAALAVAHGWPQALSADAVLAVLDAGCEHMWPEFSYNADARHEYLALRVIAARDRSGDDWGVVIERLGGGDPGALRVDRYAYGSLVPVETGIEGVPIAMELDAPIGPDGAPRHLFHGGLVIGPDDEEVLLDEAMADEQDLRPGLCCEVALDPLRIAALRAYLANVPGGLWPPIDHALAAIGIEEPELITVTEDLTHVTGPFERHGVAQRGWEVAPGESPAYRSLAEAIVARDPARFEPGEPNTDWRWHALVAVPCALPWHHLRVDRAALGDLEAALREAAIERDERGLMALSEARTLLAGTTRFEKGAGRRVGATWVQDSDRLWAALLSLADGDEAAAAMARLDWIEPPRGEDSLAPLLRYGAGILAWARAMIDGDGVLHMRPACLRANLIALADPAVLALLDGVRGVRGSGHGDAEAQRAALIEAWRAARGI